VGRKLIDIDTLEARVNFDRASNVMFLPPEYATINCINPCIFTGVTLTGNGLAGTLSVGGGTPVFLVASKQSGTTCNVFYDWTLNGAYMPWSSTGKQVYTFDNAGSYLVRALGECSPCDLTRIGQLTVNVSGNCSPGAAYDFHAPRFVRRAVSYPLTIAGTAAAITLKVYSSQSDFDQYGTAIEQLWTKNVPLCGVGYSIAVDLQLELNIANSWQLEIRSRSSLVDEENRPACGLYTPEATLGRPLLEVSRAIECPYWATNAAHEFGHELGFADAYDKDTKEPLHTQAADIMTAQGPGKVVLGAHGRILVEKYGR